jgi:hypothetical protein
MENDTFSLYIGLKIYILRERTRGKNNVNDGFNGVNSHS